MEECFSMPLPMPATTVGNAWVMTCECMFFAAPSLHARLTCANFDLIMTRFHKRLFRVVLYLWRRRCCRHATLGAAGMSLAAARLAARPPLPPRPPTSGSLPLAAPSQPKRLCGWMLMPRQGRMRCRSGTWYGWIAAPGSLHPGSWRFSTLCTRQHKAVK